MIGRRGYELDPETVDELRKSVVGQITAKQRRDYDASIDGVRLTPEAMYDLINRIAP